MVCFASLFYPSLLFTQVPIESNWCLISQFLPPQNRNTNWRYQPTSQLVVLFAFFILVYFGHIHLNSSLLVPNIWVSMDRLNWWLSIVRIKRSILDVVRNFDRHLYVFPRHGVLWQTYIHIHIYIYWLNLSHDLPIKSIKTHQFQLNPINNFAESIMGLMRISREYHGEYIANASFPSIFGGFPINQSLNGRMLSRVPTVTWLVVWTILYCSIYWEQ